MVLEGRKYGMGITAYVANMGMGFGMGLAPILAGFVVDFTDARSAFYVCSLVLVLGALFFRQFTRGPVAGGKSYAR